MPTNFCPKKDGSVEWNFIEFRASPTVDDRMQGMETNSNTFFSGERMNRGTSGSKIFELCVFESKKGVPVHKKKKGK